MKEKDINYDNIEEVLQNYSFVSTYNLYKFYRLPSKAESILEDIIKDAKEIYINQEK